jgi:hypothetical protein
MSDEWRVEVDLDDPEHGYTLGERLRSLQFDDEAKERLGGRVILTRDGPRVFAYAASEATAGEAESVLKELLDEHRLTGTTRITRYHPVESAWRDASEPLPETDEQARAEYERKEAAGMAEAAEHGEFPWEVRIDLDSLEDAIAVEQRLADDGLPVHRRWRHVLVGAPTEEAATELADRLRAQIAEATEVSVEVHDEHYPVFMLLGAAT